MPDIGPHSTECAHADGGTCYCDCKGTMHGIAHRGRSKSGGALAKHMAAVTITKRHGGGYSVVDNATGKPPGGGTERERKIADRMGDVTVTKRHSAAPDVALSAGLRQEIERVRAAMPKTRDEWNAEIPDLNSGTRDYWRKALDEHKADLDKAIAERERVFSEWEAKHGAALAADKTMKPKAKAQLRLSVTGRHDLAISHIHGMIAHAQQRVDETAAIPVERRLPQTANGKVTAVDEWKRRLDDVLRVGSGVIAEHKAALAGDDGHQRLDARVRELEKQRDEAFKFLDKAGASSRELYFPDLMTDAEKAAVTDERRAARERLDAARDDLLQAKHERGRYEQQTLMSMLTSSRQFGGVHHNAEPITERRVNPDLADGKVGKVVEPARKDWRDTLTTAEGFYPAGWLTASRDRGILRVGSASRAFHRESKPREWRAGGSELMMPTDLAEKSPSLSANAHAPGWKGEAIDVTVHEMGHRMEGSVPGLTHLEFAFIRRRSTDADGNLEPAVSLGYADKSEITYPDKWAGKYAGKTYEKWHPDNPGNANWEVFQVGMQDTFAREHEFDDGDELQAFVVGALLTLP